MGLLSVLNNIIAKVNAKQPNLVSGTNIKTINGTSLLGNGDLTISGGSGISLSAPIDLLSNVDNSTFMTVPTTRLTKTVDLYFVQHYSVTAVLASHAFSVSIVSGGNYDVYVLKNGVRGNFLFTFTATTTSYTVTTAELAIINNEFNLNGAFRFGYFRKNYSATSLVDISSFVSIKDYSIYTFSMYYPTNFGFYNKSLVGICTVSSEPNKYYISLGTIYNKMKIRPLCFQDVLMFNLGLHL